MSPWPVWRRKSKEAGGEVATVELTPSGAPANLGDNAPLSPQTLPPSARPGMPKQTRVHGQGAVGAGGDVSGNGGRVELVGYGWQYPGHRAGTNGDELADEVGRGA